MTLPHQWDTTPEQNVIMNLVYLAWTWRYANLNPSRAEWVSAKYLTPERYQLGHIFPVLHLNVANTAKSPEISRFDFKIETWLPQLLQDFQVPKLEQGTQAPSGNLR